MMYSAVYMYSYKEILPLHIIYGLLKLASF
jgi:hypothetical protein